MLPRDANLPDPTSANPSGPRPGPRPRRTVTGPALDPAKPPPALAGTPDLAALLKALGRRWFTALMLGGSLAAVAAVAAWFLLSPKFTAYSQLRVYSTQPNFMVEGGSNRGEFGVYLNTVAGQIRSHPIISAALKRDDVRKLNLDARYPDPAQWIAEELKVEFTDKSELVNILLSSADADEVLVLVKGITAAFMDNGYYAENQARVQKVADLEKVYNEANDGLKTKRGTLKKLIDQLGTSDPAALGLQQVEALASLREARVGRDAVKKELREAQGKLDFHENRGSEAYIEAAVASAQLDAAVEGDRVLQSHLTALANAQQVIDLYRNGRPTDPTYMRGQERLNEAQAAVKRRRAEVRADLEKRVRTKAEGDYEAVRENLENVVSTLTEQLAQAQKEVDELGKQQLKTTTSTTDLDELRNAIAREQKTVDDMGERLDRMRVDLRSPARVVVYQDAELQRKDIKKQLMAAVMAPVGMLLLVCGALAWWEYRRRRVHSAAEVADGLGIRVVGAVPELPHLERLAASANAFELEGHPVLESIDGLRTMLLHDAAAQGTRVVLVTSASHGEGKTTLASHLAGSLARAGRKTLLIDGDLRTPAGHQLYELPLQPGFSEVLLGEVELADALQPTVVDGLTVMTAGQWDREVIQALAREGVQGLLEKLRDEFDFVLVDSHPVLEATDSLLLGQQVDAVLLSVLRGLSEAPRVYAACQRLTALNVRVLGAVVNGTNPGEVFAARPGIPTLAAAA